jgi:hypothetical protein
MNSAEWLFNEKGGVEATLVYNDVPTLFVLRPPRGRDVENVGVFVHHNPGNQMGAMLQCACACLVEPKLTLEQLRDCDGVVAMEVVKGVQMFPVFHIS